jgi:DnaJ family protein B protein 4
MFTYAQIKPGWKAGTKIKFAGAGHEEIVKGQKRTQNLVFVIEEKPHPTFSREGDDLVHVVKVPLVDALSGPADPSSTRRVITHLDKRQIPVTLPYPNRATGGTPLKPGQEVRVSGEGFPITRKNAIKKKGDLIARIDVVFPDRVTGSQSEGIRRVLG